MEREWLSPRQYFSRLSKSPRRSLGQNFLVQPNTAARIVSMAQLDTTDVVVEIGPGLGALTRHLVSQVDHLILIEVDRALAAYLSKRLENRTPPVDIRCQDVLDISWEQLHRCFAYDAEGVRRRVVLLGNLPYHITSPLMFRLLQSRESIDRAVFMVQKEVGERFAANPGTKQYGVLSVLLQCYARIKILLRVGPQQFYPPPQVESIVVCIDFCRPEGVDVPAFEPFRNLLNAVFQQRRKTLRNSFSRLVGGDRTRLQEIFDEARIDPGRRPESLSPTEFVRLARVMESKKVRS